MLKTITVKSASTENNSDVVVLPLFSKTRKLAAATSLDRSTRSAVSAYLSRRAFKGELGECFLVGFSARSTRAVLLLGLGEAKKLSPEKTADAAGAAARALDKGNFKSAALLVEDVLPHEEQAEFVRAFVKGFSLAQYKFFISEKPSPSASVRRLAIRSNANRRALMNAVSTARVVAEHTALVRDLVNTPANDLTPSAMASRGLSLCRRHGVSCKIISLDEMKREKMGGILGVAQGSRQEPKMMVMHYNKARKDLPMVCLVGKGVTFDTGGISIKPWSGMNEMKGDMAGGAVTISAILAAARLELPLQVVGVVPCVENMPDGSAIKPGDVITSYAGKTIEVISTDAEGRLILADAITYVRKHYQPVVTIDYATLTGAVMIALGTRLAGLMGNSQPHIDALIEAGREAGEPMWQLPLDEYFYKSVKGDITDYKNYSGRNGSSCTAAALLGEFAGDAPWVHVDIAGTFWSNGSNVSYQPKGATGYGVDVTLRFLEKIANESD